MSATLEAAPAKPAGKKKLILIAGISLAVLAGGGGGAFFIFKGKPAELGKDGTPAAAATEKKRDPKAKPTFVPFESFTVNLNDKESERYAQIIFSLETIDAATGDQVKAQMPAIRGRVLMTLSSKTATELLGREGKEKLALDILGDARKSLDLSDTDKTLVEVHFSQFVMQ